MGYVTLVQYLHFFSRESQQNALTNVLGRPLLLLALS